MRGGKDVSREIKQPETRCQENIQGYQVVVGGFAPAGLYVSYYRYDYDLLGVAALRKF